MRFKKFVVSSTLIFATIFLFCASAGAVGSISGRVMLEHEVALLPVVGARVAAALESDSNFVATALTDSGGNYQIDSLPPGSYKVLACKEDLGCLFYPGVRHPDSAEAVVVNDGEATGGIDIHFYLFIPPPPPPWGLITGLITDSETGAHLASARVFAHVLRDNVYPIVYETVSDTDGGYRLRVPPESYHVFAEKPGYERGEYPGNPVQVDSGDTIRGIDIALRPSLPPNAGYITGRVTDAQTGLGIPGAWVGASGEVLRILFETRTDSNGHYFLPVSPEDRYNVRAAAYGYEPGEYSGNPVHADSGDTVPGIDIALRFYPLPNPALITGQITDAKTGEGIADAWVGASGEWLTIIFETRTGPDGRYELPVAAGGYFVRAAAQGFLPGEYPGNPVRVEAYDTAANIDISLRPITIGLGSISGRVTNAANGSPLPHALVVARQGDGFGFGSALTDENGNYRIGLLPAGFYKVAALARGFYAAIYPNRVEVRAGENTPDIDLRLLPIPPPDLGTISGLVTDDSTGEPLGCAVVAAVGFDTTLDHRIVRYAHTDSTGNYVIGGLPKIPYFVLAWARGYKGEIYDNVQRFADAAKVIPDASGINFALEKRDSTAYLLAGSVLSNANTPLGGAFVQAMGIGGVVAGSAISLPDGGFILDGLAPGNYTLSAAVDGASASQNVDLFGGSLAGVNLTLPFAADLRGDVDGNGAYEPSDVVQLINRVYLGQPIADEAAADLNCDGRLTPVDAVIEVQLVFLGQSAAVCGF